MVWSGRWVNGYDRGGEQEGAIRRAGEQLYRTHVRQRLEEEGALAGNSGVSRTIVTTMLAGSSVWLVTLFGRHILLGHWDALDVCNGLLGGLVAITSRCSVVKPWATILCSFIATLVLISLNVIALKLRYNDRLEAAKLHGGCGNMRYYL